MRKISKTIAAAAACVALGSPAFADQFIVSLSEPITEAHARVLETLKIKVVDAFEFEGANIAVLDAPGDAYLETLFNVISPKALSLAALPVDWTDDAMGRIDTAARLMFGTEMTCGFCSS